MPIRVFPPHYQLVYINFDISSFSLISYVLLCELIHGYDSQNFTHENVQVLTNFMQELMPTTKELDTIYKKQKK